MKLHYTDLSDRDAFVAQLTAEIDGEEISATGAAKRNPQDEHVETIGGFLAYGRALEVLGRKLQKRGDGLVRHHDAIRDHRELNKTPEAQKRKQKWLKKQQSSVS